jgi:hypothetical protein
MSMLATVSASTFTGHPVRVELFLPLGLDFVRKHTLKQTFIGLNKDVSAEYYSYSTNLDPQEQIDIPNVCGVACATTCYSGTGGPDPNDCQVIADALLYESKKIGQYDEVFGLTSQAHSTYHRKQYYRRRQCKYLHSEFLSVQNNWLSESCKGSRPYQLSQVVIRKLQHDRRQPRPHQYYILPQRLGSMFCRLFD